MKWKHFTRYWPFVREFTGPGEFPTQRPVTRNFDVFFDLRLNKRLSKQSYVWWFETLSCPLWRHCNVINCFYTIGREYRREWNGYHKCWISLSTCSRHNCQVNCDLITGVHNQLWRHQQHTTRPSEVQYQWVKIYTKINTKITLSWTHKEFTTPTHTSSSIYLHGIFLNHGIYWTSSVYTDLINASEFSKIMIVTMCSRVLLPIYQ